MGDVDLKAENFGISSMEISQRHETLLQINVIERANKLDLKHRATVKWTIDGGENSSFFMASLTGTESVTSFMSWPLMVLG